MSATKHVETMECQQCHTVNPSAEYHPYEVCEHRPARDPLGITKGIAR